MRSFSVCRPNGSRTSELFPFTPRGKPGDLHSVSGAAFPVCLVSGVFNLFYVKLWTEWSALLH